MSETPARVFLVTGSGRGLGAEIARAAAKSGARVVVNCRQDRAAAGRRVDELREGGAEVLACRADVTDPGQARELVDETLAAFGGVDVLVNTVGGFGWHALAETGHEEWGRIMSSNLDSVFHMCRLTVPHMRERRFGRIVNFAAVGSGATQGEPEMAAYSAAKAGVIALSRSLALEEARCGITVNVVSPGLLRDETDDRAGRSASLLGDRVPVGHPGAAEDVIRAVLFFASPAADFVTGQVVEVAGGARS